MRRTLLAVMPFGWLPTGAKARSGRGRILAIAIPAALAAFLLAIPAQAGLTLGADLDLGTSTATLGSASFHPLGAPDPPALYDVGFRIRAGWRFGLGPFFIVPEVGAGYDVERQVELEQQFGLSVTTTTTYGVGLVRVLGGARAGWSLPLLPALRFEPAIYGHVGYARYTVSNDLNGLANDVGLALDFRFGRFTVGAHLGYEVVTAQFVEVPPSPQRPPHPPPPTSQFEYVDPIVVTAGDGWLAYGIQAGVVFW